MKTKIITVLVLVLWIGSLIFVRDYTIRTTQPDIEIRYDTIKGDSIPYPVVKYKPVPFYRDTGSTKWKTQKIDTGAILIDYFAKYFYHDTLINNEHVFVALQDSISENKIIYRQPSIHYFPTYITKTITIASPTTGHIYLGGQISRFNELSFSFGILYLNNKKTAYKAAFNPFQNYYELGVFYKIR